MDPQLISQLPQYGLLILAGFAYAWLHKQHRSERAERDNDWRTFLDAQRREFGSTIERIVGDFRNSVADERQEYLVELRKVADAVAAHDMHAADIAQKIARSNQEAIVQAAAQAAAAAVRPANGRS